VAIIHLAHLLPGGSSDLPGGRSKSMLWAGNPYWRLPIWSCTARSLPGRACHHARRCALTLSPCGPHHFTHHLRQLRWTPLRWLPWLPVGWSVFCCTCRRPKIKRD